MRGSPLAGLLLLVLVLVGWVAVQRAWRRVFPEACADPDVLAGRTRCSVLECTRICERQGVSSPRSPEEETP